MTRLIVVSAALLSLAAACGEGMGGPPIGPPAPEGRLEAGSTGSGAGPARNVKRTVMQRNPFGNVAARDNLLWDGDFEWRLAFPEQYGWYASPSPQLFELGLPALELGPRCRSGLKCARVAPNAVLLGLGVASAGKPLSASVWAAPESGQCADLDVSIITQTNGDPDVTIGPDTDEPDGEGWCRYAAGLEEREQALFMFIHNKSRSDVIVDDAVVVAETSEATAMSAKTGAALAEPGEVAWAKAWARHVTRPRVTPPSDAERRMRERFLQKRWGHR